MPRLKAEVVTTAAVELSPKLLKQIKVKLNDIRMHKAEHKALGKTIDQEKIDLETFFADANEYEALKAGVEVVTPFGKVPLKIVGGKTAPKLNLKKVMNKLYVKDKKGNFTKAVPADFDDCMDPGKDKKEYLGIWLPSDESDDEDDQ